ncbi:MAG: SHOCT domain-containing protein [Nocardioides sp.]|nr:SHOCT domain-containing protein [Nocardioides sp.]
MDVDVKQTMTQKARGVFSVFVHVNRGHVMEHVPMEDIREGREAQRVINEAAHHERLRLQQEQNTMRYQGAGYPLQPAAAPESERPTTDADPIEQLQRLGKLRDAGVVTDDEFAAKKAEILARL